MEPERWSKKPTTHIERLPCPRPDKASFTSLREARRAIARNKTATTLYAYACECRRWHLTSSEYKYLK